MRTYVLCLIGITVALSSCGTTTSVNDAAPELTALPFGTWELTIIEPQDGNAVVVADPARYTIEFRNESAVHIRADCNRCNGNYETQGQRLELGLLACTLAACPPDSLSDTYLEALGSSTSFDFSDGDELLLIYPNGVLHFSSQ